MPSPRFQAVTIMKNCCLIFAITLFCIGCGDPDRQKLVGTWRLKQSSAVEKRISETGDSVASKMSLRFKSNGGLSTITRMGNIDSQKTGSWEFLSFDEKTQIMDIKCLLETQSTEHKIEFLPDNRIKLTPPNMAGLNSKLEFQLE